MDNDAVVEKLNKEKGRNWDLAKAIIDYKNCNYATRERYLGILSELLLEGNPKTLSEVFNNGPVDLFARVYGKETAAFVGKAVSRLHSYVHSPSTYRRSFRTKEIAPYLDRLAQILTDLLFFPWEHFDMLHDLTTPRKEDDDNNEKAEARRFPQWLYGDFIAVRIDAGDAGIIKAIKDICLGDNNTKLLSHAIINGIVKSENKELHKLLGDMLLAAKLQEGLRQSILENADNGRVEAFIYLMKIVIDNDLIRYSSALRALDVWLGLGENYDDRRTAEKLLKLCYTYLTDKKALNAGLESKDVTEIYAGLWALSVREMNYVLKPIEKLLSGEKYQKLVGLYFAGQLENSGLQFAITSKIIAGFTPDKADLDILGLTMENYPVSSYYPWRKEDFAGECRKNRFLADKKIRDEQFAGLLGILPLVPQKGYAAEGKPFPWRRISLEPKDISTRLLNIAGYDFESAKTDRLMGIMPLADSYSRVSFIKIFLENPASQKERDFLFASLNDKSMGVRSQALENVLALAEIKEGKENAAPLSDDEEKLIIDLLALKTGDLRQNSLKILLSLPENRSLEAAKILLADKNENKRLGGLDIIAQLVNGGKMDRREAAVYIALMPRAGDREQVLIKAITAEAVKYTKANGFGLYNPDYRPVFPTPETDPKHGLASIFGLSPERAKSVFSSLCETIRKHKDCSYQIENYDGVQDVVLGGLAWPKARAESRNDKNKTMLECFVLQEVWRDWMKKKRITFSELFYFMFLEEVKGYHDAYEPDYQDWANALVENFFHARDMDALIRWMAKQEYGTLALHIVIILWTEFPEAERFAALAGALVDMLKKIPEDDWKKSIEDENSRRYSREEPETFFDAKETRFIIRHLREAVTDDGRFKTYTAFCFELGRLSGMFYQELEPPDIARGIALGILEKDALYRTMFLTNPRNLGGYAGKIRWDGYKKNAEKYPLLKTVADEAAVRVIEIELDRGDSETEVSRLALAISWHEGAETFVKILTALGDETFVRGYIYSGSGTKKAVLSSLLKASHPGVADNAETLRAALGGKNLSEKRLIEAAMYAPSWLDIVGDYLGWPGLKSAAWYFHAHINETFSAEKETEAARYSPISPEEFNDGAFDINWFWDAYKTLGAERFDLVYDCAKYLTEGSNHRRAQLFADAVLGRLDIDTLEKEIHEKRNKDKLLSYSLIPLMAQDATQNAPMSEALRRYEFIQMFLKESKSFGAQRRESEGKACAIASDNLARNAGFSDALRFTWRMETLKIEEVKSFFEPADCGAYRVHVEIAEDGSASLVCEKDGKRLSAVPAALKKEPYIAECKAVVSSLKAQFNRARESLERAMVNRDVFEYGEIKTLLSHPVVSPLLQKLVFAAIDSEGKPQKSGAFCELAGLRDTSPLRIAHPYDLYTLGTWLGCQRYAFEHKLVQPFKQIFRELYLINEDEQREKTVSRRYAGHQVQPKKTVALLKGRGWTVDYEEGLQRVYYRDNFYATVYAAADWFSPADTEAPTLETVQFFPRRLAPGAELKPLELQAIPPVIFSEVMRDMDLVVSVAHVGGVDPEASHSTVEMRAAIVRELLALLRIENVSVEDRYAKIKGSLGEYTVHLGSAQVHKMGRGAVNILAVPSQHRGRVFLPFADEDPRTAELMSKIIMLADDKSIKDPAILDQIE